MAGFNLIIMTFLSLFTALMFVIAVFTMVSMFVLGVVLGPTIKKYDRKTWGRIYALYMPLSALVLHGYVVEALNEDKLPKQKRWMLVYLKHAIPTFFVTATLMFVIGYFAFTD